MPTDLAGLRGLAQTWKQRFAGIRILGQIELSRDETARYWRALNSIYFCRGPEAFRRDEVDDLDCVTAVVLANLAYYSGLDETGESQQREHGWVEHFTRDLHWSESDRQALWEARIGSRVRRVLVSYLGYVETEQDAGSFRFVRPAVRQAGVPLGQVGKFLEWLRPLARLGHVTRDSYRRYVERRGLPGSIIAWFLRTDDGFEFCSALVRGIAERAAGGVPGIRPEILEVAQTSLRVGRSPRTEVAREPMPRFCFDIDRLELGVSLPEGGRVHYHLDDYRVFGFLSLRSASRSSSDHLRVERRIGTSSSALFVDLRGFGRRDFWAAFSVGGGRFLAGSSSPAAIPAGRSVVVGTAKAIDELGTMIVERLGELELPSWAPERLEAVICAFDSPCRLFGVYPDAITPVPVPTLSIDSGERPFRDVYLDPPTIRVLGWSENSDQDYRAFWSVDTGGKAASPRQSVPVDAKGRLVLPPRPDRTARICVWLEPRGFAPRGWDEQAALLEFVLLAPGSVLGWPVTLLAFDEAARFGLSGGDIESVTFDGRELEALPDGSRMLPFVSGRVEFVVRTTGGLVASLTARTPRVGLSASVAEFREWPVLFQEDLSRDAEIWIAMPAAGLPESVGVGVLTEEKLRGATALPVSREARRTGWLRVGGRSLSDALRESQCSAGPLGLSLDGRSLCLGASYARTPRALILSATSENRNVLLGYLGADKTELLQSLSTIVQRPVRIPSDAGRGRVPLERALAELRYVSEELDFGGTQLEPPSHRPELASLHEAAERTNGRMHGTELATLRGHLDAFIEDYGWVPRWRAHVEELGRRLEQVTDSRVAFKEWTAAFSGAVVDELRIRNSVVCRMPGGTSLTEGARKLLLARRASRPVDFLGGCDGAFAHLRRAEEQAGESSPARFIAGLLIADAYRAAGDRRGAQRRDRQLLERAPEPWKTLGQEVRVALGLTEPTN